MVHLHASRRWIFNPMWKAAMSNQGRLMEFASLVYSPHRAEPPTRMPEPGASVFVSLSKRRTEPDSLRQFVSKATRLGSRVAFWRWRRISPDACARASVNWPRVTDDTANGCKAGRALARAPAADRGSHYSSRCPDFRWHVFRRPPMRHIRSACSARAASGQATTAPPSSVMKWRRFS